MSRLDFTALTHAQHTRLDSIESEDPWARVVRWDGGPIIVRGDGRIQRLRNTGRVTPVRRVPAGSAA